MVFPPSNVSDSSHSSNIKQERDALTASRSCEALSGEEDPKVRISITHRYYHASAVKKRSALTNRIAQANTYGGACDLDIPGSLSLHTRKQGQIPHHGGKGGHHQLERRI